MGLLLSVLVVCVGFAELVGFYNRVRRNLAQPAQIRDLQTVKDGYHKELQERLRKSPEPTTTVISTRIDNSLENPRIKLSRDILSHEDIEIEINKNVVLERSKPSSQRRYLVTEKESKSRSSSPRRFLVSEEPQGLQRSHAQNSVPEFLFQETRSKDEACVNRRIVLKDPESAHGRSASPLPLPKQFVLTEEEVMRETAQIEFDENFFEAETNFRRLSESFSESVVFHSTVARTENLLQAEADHPARSKSPSPIPRRFATECAEAFRRSPSPFPSFELLAPRNSICTELLDNPSVSVTEVDEELYRSHSGSPNEVDVITEDIANTTTEYRTNQLQVTTPQRSNSPQKDDFLKPPKRSRSKSESDSKDYNLNVSSVKKTTSNFIEQEISNEISDEDTALVLDAKFLNSLDGTASKKRKNKKRKPSQNSLDKPSTSASVDNPDAAKELEKSPRKEPEAFWVNR